jgi:23S rRNA (adenine2503-C2)-methyltransferase
MGEPLHNYDETMKALRILADPQGFALPPRRITLSTVGLLPALERLASEPVMPNLAISLHAPTDLLRGELVPLNKKYGVAEIIAACQRFPLQKRRRITFEYVLLAGVNDSPQDARLLAKLLARVKSKVNLIPLNAAPDSVRAAVRRGGNRFAKVRGCRLDRVGAQEPRPRLARHAAS